MVRRVREDEEPAAWYWPIRLGIVKIPYTAGEYHTHGYAQFISFLLELQNDYNRILHALQKLAKDDKERKMRLEKSDNGAGFAFTEVYERLSNEEFVSRCLISPTILT